VSKQKLLLADDSITIQKVVNLTFADEGIEVIAVGDGDAAMKKFVEVTPDLVMADVNMPGIDGYRICEMIKQDDETKHIPVILLVGSFEPFDEEEARRVGANDYLTKPFQSIRQLVNKVTDLLNSPNGEDAASVEETAQSESGETAAPVYMETAAAELGDAGMDDEMIQTNQIGSLPIDEPQKFESDSAGLTAGNIPLTTLSSPYQSDFGSSTEYQTGGDFAKTQPLSTQEFHEITATFHEDEAAPTEEKVYEIADEQNFEQAETTDESEIAEPEISDSQTAFEPEEVDEQQFSAPELADKTEQPTIDEIEPTYTDESQFAPTAETSETFPMPEAASILDLDEMNLLELPPREKKFSPDFQTAPVELKESNFHTDSIEPQESEAVAEELITQPSEMPETPQTESSEAEEYFETISDSAELISLSPQSIEAIAERVADLVIQKLAQASVDEN